MIDLSIGKLLVIGVFALFLVSPQKLPIYAAQLGRWVRVARNMMNDAKQRVATEMGPEFDDVDWAALDPRKYHPRRLLADAWNAETDERPSDRRDPAAATGTGGRPADEVDLLELADVRAKADERPVAAVHFDIGS